MDSGLKPDPPSVDKAYVLAQGFGRSMADSALQVGGLATGLDTTSIINGLISIEQQRVTREEDKKADIELKLSTFNDLKTKLSDFYTQAKEMAT
jgi:flagellar capping protein FliD